MGTDFLFLSFFFLRKKLVCRGDAMCAKSEVHNPLAQRLDTGQIVLTNFLLPRGQAYRRMGCGAMQFSYFTLQRDKWVLHGPFNAIGFYLIAQVYL